MEGVEVDPAASTLPTSDQPSLSSAPSPSPSPAFSPPASFVPAVPGIGYAPPMYQPVVPMVPVVERRREDFDLADPEHPDNYREHKAADGRVYYYNKVTKKSVWTRPAGFLTEEEKKQPVSSEPIFGTDWIVITTRGGSSYYHNIISKETSWTLPEELNTAPATIEEQPEEDSTSERPSKRKADGSIDDADEPPTKKARLDEERPSENLPTEEAERLAMEATQRRILEMQQQMELERKQEEERRRLAERAVKEYEERHNAFNAMLAEKNFPAFTPWKKAVPVIVNDPRFQLLPSESDRKSAFDAFMRNQMTALNKFGVGKKQARKEAHNAFEKMMDELGDKLTIKTTIKKLKKLCKHDPRWEAVESRDRVMLLSKKIGPMQVRHQERVDEAKAEFTALLKDTPGIDPQSSWSQTSKGIKKDPRYHKDLLSSEDREALFREYQKELKRIADAEMIKQKREELSRRERERQVRAELAEAEEKMAQERSKLRRENEMNAFRALLAETVHTSQFSWRDVKRRISGDPRFNTVEIGDRDKERLFRERMDSLQDTRLDGFKYLLMRSPINLASTWKEVRELIRDDPDFRSVSSERRREEMFEEYMQSEKSKAEADFRTLLMSFPKITADSPSDGPGFELIEEMLRGDIRWQKYDCLPEQRKVLLRQYTDDLRNGRVSRVIKVGKTAESVRRI